MTVCVYVQEQKNESQNIRYHMQANILSAHVPAKYVQKKRLQYKLKISHISIPNAGRQLI